MEVKNGAHYIIVFLFWGAGCDFGKNSDTVAAFLRNLPIASPMCSNGERVTQISQYIFAD